MNQSLHFLIGSQEDEEGYGISHGVIDCVSGTMRLEGLAAQVRRPTWIEVDQARNRAFACSEIGNKGDVEGDVLSFALADREKPLRLVDQASSLGGGATHLTLDKSGNVFVANFGGANAALLEVANAGTFACSHATPVHTGSGPHRRQTSPHPHGVTIDPGGRFLMVPDMGNDQIVIHALNGTAGAFPREPHGIVALPAGSGPRLLVFGKDGARAFMLSELSAELFVFDWDSIAGVLSLRSSTRLDADAALDGEPSAAALALSPDGRFIYVSNRRTHAVQVYAIVEPEGSLVPVQTIASGGQRPWHIAISPDGQLMIVSNQASNSLQGFAIDRKSGNILYLAGAAVTVPTPTCVAFSGL